MPRQFSITSPGHFAYLIAHYAFVILGYCKGPEVATVVMSDRGSP